MVDQESHTLKKGIALINKGTEEKTKKDFRAGKELAFFKNVLLKKI